PQLEGAHLRTRGRIAEPDYIDRLSSGSWRQPEKPTSPMRSSAFVGSARLLNPVSCASQSQCLGKFDEIVQLDDSTGFSGYNGVCNALLDHAAASESCCVTICSASMNKR